MAITLPKSPVAPTRVNPKILIIYSQPKVGKTFQINELEKLATETGAGNVLEIDTEDGASGYAMTRIDGSSHKKLVEIRDAIVAEGNANLKAGLKGDELYPYKWGVLDTLSWAEEFAWKAATDEYKASVIGKDFKGKSVIELPRGLGYYYHREKIKEYILDYAASFKYLILVCHLSDSEHANKDLGTMVNSKAVSLTGKLKEIVPGMVDAIGYLFRTKDGKAWINFETVEGSAMGARNEHLRGKKFEMDWRKIYLGEFDGSNMGGAPVQIHQKETVPVQ
jgi:hypothetical protein